MIAKIPKCRPSSGHFRRQRGSAMVYGSIGPSFQTMNWKRRMSSGSEVGLTLRGCCACMILNRGEKGIGTRLSASLRSTIRDLLRAIGCGIRRLGTDRGAFRDIAPLVDPRRPGRRGLPCHQTCSQRHPVPASWARISASLCAVIQTALVRLPCRLPVR